MISPVVATPMARAPLPTRAASSGIQPAAVDRVEVSGALSRISVPEDAARSRVSPVDLAPLAAASATPGPIGVCLRMILAGPPGAGKTTHGVRIAREYGVPEISIGNLLRAEVKAGTDIGKEIEPMLERGDLAPIEVVSTVLERRLAQPDAARGFILDGIPRRLDDAHLLERICEKMNLPAIPMLVLDVPDSEILGRVENRRVCDNQHTWDVKSHPPKTPGVCDEDGLVLKRRPDDEPAVVEHRLQVYHQETEPVFEYYRERGLLYEVPGVGSIEAVSARVLERARHLTTQA